MNKKSLLKSMYKQIIDELLLEINIGIELEFYLSDNIKNPEEIIKKIIVEAHQKNIAIPPIKNEKGKNQYELEINYNNPVIIAEQIEDIKNIICQITDNNCSFEARRYPDRPGSAVHFNISLHDLEGRNLLIKNNEYINNHLSYAIGGMIELMKESMICFAPNNDSYDRFKDNFETPTKICWGVNNRTASIRIPTCRDRQNLRIEHRVAGADCDIYASIISIIISIYYGINNKIDAAKPIYGNAFDNQYQLEDIPKSLKESRKYFKEGKIIRKYLEKLVEM